MKIYKWIDKYNKKNSLKIIRKYHFGRSAGKSKTYCLHTSFWLKYILRLLLVFFSIISFQKTAYKGFFKLFSSRFSPFCSPTKNVLYIKLSDFFATLFGYRYFVYEEILPLLNNKNLSKLNIEIPIIKNPIVSIIIPVYNHLDYTYNCLKSLQLAISDKYAYEIIVVDDCSTDETALFFANNVKGVTYFRNENNKGFLLSSNQGAELAKGKFICFLNNDVQVKSNWLEYLIDTFEDETVGLVGSKLIYANGMLQEAGGIVFNDANAANYGRYDDIESPSYNYARETDYCSGASIMLLKEDFEKLGNFDLRYTPAYYEDTDLCFAVRHILDKKVIYQPFSEVIHFEGISSGTDVEKHPVKKYQSINKLKFYEKWANQLVNYPSFNDFKTALHKFYINKIVLIIDDTIPEPDKDSGSVRLTHIIDILKSIGYHIIFMPNDGNKKEKYFERLASIGVEVLYKFPNRNGMISMLQKRLPDVNIAWICKPQNNMVFEHIVNDEKLVRVYDTIDLHFLRIEREAELKNDQLLVAEAKKIKEREIEYAKASDVTIAITNDEKLILNNEGIENVVVIPNIHVNKNNQTSNASFNDRNGILFIGGYVHTPNTDAAKWLIEKIMPLVWKVNPDMHVTLLGSNPNNDILALKSKNVSVPGYVEDVSEYFNRSKIFVAPLRYGAGMKGKIGQSLSYGLPVITTSIGAEGMELVNETDFLLANLEEEFAKRISILYNDEELWFKLSKASLASIDRYSPLKIKSEIQLLLAQYS